MIIAELETQSVKFEGGMCLVTMPVKTDRGVVGAQFCLKLSEHPELDALMPQIDDALRKAVKKSLGMANMAGLQPAPEA